MHALVIALTIHTGNMNCIYEYLFLEGKLSFHEVLFSKGRKKMKSDIKGVCLRFGGNNS